MRQQLPPNFNALADLTKTLEHFMSVYSHFIVVSEGCGGVMKSAACDGKNYEFVNYGGDERETRAREETHALLLMRAKRKTSEMTDAKKRA